MLHALELENFKAFGKRARIPFAPITLIFGENSAGKSTILQALNLLKQTRENRETGALLLPRSENGIVDLGSFREMLFDHDLKRTLSIRLETKSDEMGGFRLPLRKNTIGIEFSFKKLSHEAEVFIDIIKIYYGRSTECVAKFQPLVKTVVPQDFMMMRFFPDSRGFSPSKLSSMECVWLTKEPDYWESEFRWSKKNKKKILQALEERLKNLQHSDEDPYENSDERKERLDSLKSGIELFKSDFDLNAYISKRCSDEMNTVLELQGFLPIRIRSSRRNYWISEFHASVLLSKRIFDIAQLTDAASLVLEQTLEDFFPMGPFRSPAERLYTFIGTSPQDVGYRGNLLPHLLFRRPERVKATNEWLKRLDMGYELEVELVETNSGDVFEVRLIDTRRKERVSVALPDVGFGISQLLPFIVQSLVAEEQIISIEQPEVHVHPKLQADLGELLAAAIKKDNPNQFIVETHSEHLILRLQRLVRKQQIKPEDISVIYVSRGPEGAKAERLHLDDEGDFIDEWPNGFFPERLREL